MMILFQLFLSTAMAVTLQSETAGTYRRNGEAEAKSFAAGESVSMESGDQILFQAVDQIPILIVVPRSSADKIQLTSAQQKDMLSKATQRSLNVAAQDLAFRIPEIQKNLKDRNISEAHKLIAAGIEKFPEVAVFYFMQGTAFYLENNKEMAIKSLEKGLALDSSAADAQKLLKKLKGGL